MGPRGAVTVSLLVAAGACARPAGARAVVAAGGAPQASAPTVTLRWTAGGATLVVDDRWTFDPAASAFSEHGVHRVTRTPRVATSRAAGQPPAAAIDDPAGTRTAWIEARRLCVADRADGAEVACWSLPDDARPAAAEPERRLRALLAGPRELGWLTRDAASGQVTCERWTLSARGEGGHQAIEHTSPDGSSTRYTLEIQGAALELMGPAHVGRDRGEVAAEGCLEHLTVGEISATSIEVGGARWFLELGACRVAASAASPPVFGARCR
jgi:hypothetical protein